jgi:subfamily B ATP-binding cassette protein MsbA
MSKSKQTSDLLTYKRLLSYVVSYWLYFLISIVGFMLFSSSQIALADLMQFIVDTLSGNAGSGRGLLTGLFTDGQGQFSVDATPRELIVATIVVVGLVRGVGYFVGNYYINYVGTYLVHSMRCDIFNKLMILPSATYDKNPSSFLISKIIYNVEQVTGAATKAIQVIIREGFLAIGLLAYLFYLSWELSLLFIIAFPFIASVVVWVSGRFRKISHNIQDAVGGVTEVTGEAVSGYREIRVFGGTENECERFVKASDRNRAQSMKMAFYKAVSPPVIQLPLILVLATLIWMALGVAAEMSAGEFVAYLTAAMLMPKPIRQLSTVNSIVQRGLAACDDIFDFLDLEPEVDQGHYETKHVNGEIEFKSVSFSYAGTEEQVLTDISFTSVAGQTVALVGLSGSGKTTLVSLLARFYNHKDGQILLDGVDVNDYTLNNLREHISLVGQNVTLFNDTVYNNIAYGSMADRSREDVIAAAVAAHAMDFIDKLPQGLDTMVGEDGVLLSGGQKQRIAIARALLKDAPVLILDEATSALDNKAEFHIQEALQTVMEGRTTFVIAHRLSTIENADVILVMDSGKIIEQGTHQQLLEKGGSYSLLHSREFNE